MDHHPPPSRARRPRRSDGSTAGRRTLRLVTLRVALLAIALVVAGCSGDSSGDELADRLADTGDAASDGTDPTDDDTGEATPTLRDPVDAGFDSVEDVEIDPVEAPSAGGIDLTDDEPEAVIEEVADQLDDLDEGTEVLDAVDPVDQAADETPVDDGRPRNEVGELLTLDDEASLACAQIEIGIGHIDEGLPAAATERIVSGAERAEASAVADIRAWAEPLRAVVADGPAQDLAPLVGFLSVCTEGGYEL